MRPAALTLVALALLLTPSRAGADAATDYVLHCRGCHGPDGDGAPGAVPSFRGQIARFLHVDGGREYLVRVPGTAQSELDDARLAALLNWMLHEYDPAHIPEGFPPFAAEEIARQRRAPLVHAEEERRALMAKMSEAAPTEVPRSPDADHYRWDFDGPAATSGADYGPGFFEIISDMADLRQANGTLSFRAVGGDPYFYVNHLQIDTARAGYVVLRLRVTAGRRGQIFVRDAEEHSLAFPLLADGEFHTYTVPMRALPAWTGTLRRLRFDLTDVAPARVEVDFIAVTDVPGPAVELHPAPPARIYVAPGAAAAVEVGLANLSGEPLEGIEMALAAPGALVAPAAPQRIASLGPGATRALRWEVTPPASLQAELRLSLVNAALRLASIRFEVRGEIAPGDGTARFEAIDPGAPPSPGGAAKQVEIPGDIHGVAIDAEPGAAATAAVELVRAGERATAVVDLPRSEARRRYGLDLRGLGGGWTLRGAVLPGHRPSRVAFLIRPAVRLHLSLRLDHRTFVPLPRAAPSGERQPDASGSEEVAYIVRAGEDISVAVHAHNFGVEPATVRPLVRLWRDGEVAAESRLKLDLAAGAAGVVRTEGLRAPSTGRHRLEVDEEVSGLQARGALAVIAGDHTSRALEREWRRAAAALDSIEPDRRRPDDEPLPGFEIAGDGAVQLLVSELSPAVRIATTSSELTLFGRLAELGLGGPQRVAYGGEGGVQLAPIAAGAPLPTDLRENWMLFWFDGAAGWDRLVYSEHVQRHLPRPEPMALDAPFLVVFQHRPAALSAGEGGVVVRFAAGAGTIAVMPLFGARRVPAAETAGWHQGLPAEVVERVRFWSRTLLAYPVHVREDFALDHGRDVVAVRQQFRFHTVADDWSTPPLRLAPLPPAVSLAARAGWPLKLPPDRVDTGVMTPFGPYEAVPERDTIEYEIGAALDHLRRVPIPDTAPGSATVERLRADFVRSQSGPGLHSTGIGWFGGASASQAQGFKTAAVPFAPAAEADLLRAVAQDQLSFFVLDDPGDYVMALDDSRRGVVVLVDSFNHTLRYPGDDAAGSGAILRGLWEYAYNSGDWGLVRSRWGRVRQAMNQLSGEQTWSIGSRPNSGGDTFHDVLLGTAAYARLAAALGEAGDYRYGAYLFAKMLLSYFDYERASLDYARANTPWLVPLSDEPMVNWDYYTVFGPFFAPLSAGGAYGEYSGFYEHYYRMGEGKGGLGDLLPRFYRERLGAHARLVFGAWMAERVPSRCSAENRTGSCAQVSLDDLRSFVRARVLLEPSPTLRHDYPETPALLRTLLESEAPSGRRDVVPPALRDLSAGLWQRGVDADALGIGHGYLLGHAGDGDFDGLPMLSWFGLNAGGKRLELHRGNLLAFGVFSPELRPGAYAAGERRVNWTTRVHSFSPRGGAHTT